MKKFREWLSIQQAENPGRMVLIAILAFNVLFFFVATAVISALSLNGTEQMGFIEAAFCTITMILDAGCISYVVADIGTSGILITLFCLFVVVVGMISFTGAVIGYVTNYISNFIDNSNAGRNKLHISGHTVILNWNTRASEIINDMLYNEGNQKIVVLANTGKAEIEQEIEERLADTIAKDLKSLREQYKSLPYLRRKFAIMKHRVKNNLTVIVREGDVFSSKQLQDISLPMAKAIIILGSDGYSVNCNDTVAGVSDSNKGNSLTIKTLMQVADIASSGESMNNQKIIVEVTDDWTWDLVDRIVACKQVDGKCNIVPVKVNMFLGQILAQFSLMPELNTAYRELFSNKGASFYTEKSEKIDEVEFVRGYLKNHRHAIPLTFMDIKSGSYVYYSAESRKSIHKISEVPASDYTVSINRDYWIEKKNVVILGHNSKCRDIMMGFMAFESEWGREDEEILSIVVIDNKESLERMNYYKEYPFVTKTVAAEIYDKDLICSTIEAFVDSNEEDTSVLILSDDTAHNEETDANALANLIYVQDIINRKTAENPDFDPMSIDMVVEIIDPKHHDVVNSYNVNNVVISNRYISKMITQISEKEALFDFYADILTYDLDGSEGFDGKEVYIKKASRFFTEIPAQCTVAEFIRAVYLQSTDPSIPREEMCPSMVLGYVKPDGKLIIFSGDQMDTIVNIEPRDKLVMFTNH